MIFLVMKELYEAALRSTTFLSPRQTPISHHILMLEKRLQKLKRHEEHLFKRAVFRHRQERAEEEFMLQQQEEKAARARRTSLSFVRDISFIISQTIERVGELLAQERRNISHLITKIRFNPWYRPFELIVLPLKKPALSLYLGGQPRGNNNNDSDNHLEELSRVDKNIIFSASVPQDPLLLEKKYYHYLRDQPLKRATQALLLSQLKNMIHAPFKNRL